MPGRVSWSHGIHDPAFEPPLGLSIRTGITETDGPTEENVRQADERLEFLAPRPIHAHRRLFERVDHSSPERVRLGRNER